MLVLLAGEVEQARLPLLKGLTHLADLGVSWVQVGVPGDSPARAAEAVARYGELVIGPLRAGS